jgi:hypothetical protein
MIDELLDRLNIELTFPRNNPNFRMAFWHAEERVS